MAKNKSETDIKLNEFLPGRNIWKRVNRWLFLSITRIIIAAVFFFLTVFGLNFFPYNIGRWGFGFIVFNVILAVFMMLPSSAQPGALMYEEIFRSIVKRDLHSSADVHAMTPQAKENQDGFEK
ncbi:hypothetical protein [Fructobacillus fructosus]|uniref:Uncharacterized protein n=1 Tax=Fructobacillus fructosus TaxID=1631 RepID=A0ABM9MZP6_9LACO|nr:hypothetical protein [Fructobacillus fructosus]MBC9119283.1 hypothetical protein [Fructobacillus fructosus]MBD9366961.1 hypothetical protein [Leuconostoc mesenteroides]CAK1251375.1 hypothetical protein R54839_PPFHFPJH_01384 [Fructobacillus fructosus]